MKTILALTILLSACRPAFAGAGYEQLFGASPAPAQPAPAVSAPENLEKGLGGGDPAGYNPGSYVRAADKAFRHLPNYITLYAIPSPYPMDWSTITTLAMSFARNQFAVSALGQTHGIGHVAFEVGCTLPNGSRKLVVTGQAPKDKASMGGFIDQAKAGEGYSAFFNHVPGRLERRADLEKTLDSLSNVEGEVAFLTLKVSQVSCLEAQRFIQAYDDANVDTRYGLGVRPLYKEGGGCANVGAAVVEVAGPNDFAAISKTWTRTFYIPNELLGGPSNHVGLGDVLDYWSYDWSKKTARPHKKLFFYDPDLMYNWIKAPKPAQAAWDNSPAKYTRYKINNSPGLLLDYTSTSSPTSWWKTGK
jgi:hypothetical protein